MYGISLDDEPDRPVGTAAVRRSNAIHWNWTTDATEDEIGDALGVSARTVRRYLNEGPTDAVREQMEGVEAEVRMVAVAELRDQLRRAGHRSRTAETPVKVWPEDGDLHVVDVVDEESGKIKDKYPLPEGFEVGADEQTRYYAREEVREILDQLVSLTGAGEPEEVSVDHSGSLFDLPPEVTDNWERSDGDSE